MHSNSKSTALVTGASSGIGAIYADRLAARGHDLILVARNKERLTALASKLSDEHGIRVEVVISDLSQKADLGRVEKILKLDHRISMLVNNAGISMSGDLAGADSDQLEQMMLVNALAPTRLILAALPGFLARANGTIINISSVLALAPEMFNGAYSGTKAHLLNLSIRLQEELVGTGVRLQVVLPGATRTEIWERGGTDIATLPQSILMDAADMVDASLNGLDRGENVTIPSLPEMADWDAFNAARKVLFPNLSRNTPAARYASTDPAILTAIFAF